jgi:exosome complex RNA-binding protein Rrp42 (RNase PH superfamily)
MLSQSGASLLCDPALNEEAASSGRATLFINPHGDICGWQMAEGVGLDQAQMMR